ncbi:MAG: helix-turn-helix transcriptional regulator [Glaciimonas sp.]|nr:helix-turn-helix transcriptional regulator [Glaciimonas sp.]
MHLNPEQSTCQSGKAADIFQWLETPAEYFSEQEYPLNFGVCCGLIDRRIRLSQPTVSAHLATLQCAELVIIKRVEQWIFHKCNEETIQAFLAHLHIEL